MTSYQFEREPLDDVLLEWAQTKRAREQHLEDLRERLVENVDEMEVSRAVDRDRASVWRTVSIVAVGTSLVLLFALCWSLTGRQSSESNQVATAPIYVLPKISETELAHKRVLVSELERVFDRQFAWIVETDGEVHLGVDQKQVSAEDSVPIVVRVAVMRRKVGQTQWQHVWSADVVSHSEQLVELTPEGKGDSRLSIWAFALPDGMIAVDGEMHLKGEDGIKPVFSDLHKAGDSTSVFTTTLDEIEYQVFQTVALLNGDVT